MKNYILFAAFFILLGMASVYAGSEQGSGPLVVRSGQDSDGKQAGSGFSVKRFMFMAGGGLGLSMASGDVEGTGGQTTKTGRAYTIGLKAGYNIFSSGGPVLGMDYMNRQLVSEKRYQNTSDMRTTIEATHVMLSLGYRHNISVLFMEGGFFYGIRPGIWTRSVSLDGKVTTTQLHGSLEKQTKNDAGGYLEGGVMAPVTERTALSIGVRFIIPFIDAYSYDDSLKGNAMMIMLGWAYHM